MYFYFFIQIIIALIIFNVASTLIALMRCNYGLKFLDFQYPDRNDVSYETLLNIHMGYIYFLSKFVDLIDTFFFVIRKKYSQITFLHLYHHTVVPLFGWLFLKINPNVPPVHLFAIINSFIHIVILIMHYLLWDQNFRNICGGKSISQFYNWHNFYLAYFTPV